MGEKDPVSVSPAEITHAEEVVVTPDNHEHDLIGETAYNAPQRMTPKLFILLVVGHPGWQTPQRKFSTLISVSIVSARNIF